MIPADAIILKGEGNIDYSFVSGENTPLLKRKGDEDRQSNRSIYVQPFLADAFPCRNKKFIGAVKEYGNG